MPNSIRRLESNAVKILDEPLISRTRETILETLENARDSGTGRNDEVCGLLV
jgi:hypothetical protein